MQSVKNRYVSSLDLKYLDAKFIAIHDSRPQINNSLNELRKSRTGQLPSIFKSIHDDDTTLYTSAVLPQSRFDTQQSRIPARYQSVDKSVGDKIMSSEQLAQVNRYKKMIEKIKRDNDVLHKEITKLYREEQICTKQPKKKPIKTILQAGKGLMSKSSSAIRLSSEARHYDKVYEDLSKQDNPYRKESLELQKKFINNNFHKNFETFLLSHNRRVPQFLKNIR